MDMDFRAPFLCLHFNAQTIILAMGGKTQIRRVHRLAKIPPKQLEKTQMRIVHLSGLAPPTSQARNFYIKLAHSKIKEDVIFRTNGNEEDVLVDKRALYYAIRWKTPTVLQHRQHGRF